MQRELLQLRTVAGICDSLLALARVTVEYIFMNGNNGLK